MLAVCTKLGWDIRTYPKKEHPIQKWIDSIVSEYCGVEQGTLHTEIDGCGVPAFAVNLIEAAQSYARLMSCDALSEAGVVRKAMMSFPEMVSGEGHFVAQLIRSSPGIVTKTGGEGLLAIGVESSRVPRELSGRALGIALKCEDGNGRRGTYPAALELLARFSLISPGELSELECYRRIPIVNRHGEEVGVVRVSWS
jgi:L-asparaginase II